jgi:nicotinamide-nucleotide amidase
VSAEVATEMALGLQKLMHVDYVIATTGNAGPSKGDVASDLGTVFIAIAGPKGVFVEEFNFGQPREKVIDRAVGKSLELIYKEILKK